MMEMIRSFPLISKCFNSARMNTSSSRAILMHRISAVEDIPPVDLSEGVHPVTGQLNEKVLNWKLQLLLYHQITVEDQNQERVNSHEELEALKQASGNCPLQELSVLHEETNSDVKSDEEQQVCKLWHQREFYVGIVGPTYCLLPFFYSRLFSHY